VIEYFELGPTPCDEPCAQVGEEGYEIKARAECKRFITLLIKKFGHPPDGSSYVVKSNSHDFGTYYEVAIKYNTNSSNKNMMDYMFKVEDNLPYSWDDEA
jgi:hypothetical protein